MKFIYLILILVCKKIVKSIYNIPIKGKNFCTKASGLKPNLGKIRIIPIETSTKNITFNTEFNL